MTTAKWFMVAGAILIAALLFEQDPRIGGLFLVILVFALLTAGIGRGTIQLPQGGSLI